MRGLTLKQLEAARAVARHGSVTAAAGAAGITPSAMTTRIKELEAICGLALFDRTATGLRVNRAGALVVDMADRVQATIEIARGALAGLNGVTMGALAVGITSTAKYFAPRLIADFGRRYPGVEIALSVGNRMEILESLRRLSVDVVIMGRAPDRLNLISEAFGDHPMVIIAPPDHPLAGRRAIGREAVAQEPFLVREEGSGTRAVFEEFFQGRTARRGRLSIEIGSNETIKQGVMAGLGLALISAHTIAAEVEAGRLTVLDVDGLPIMRQWFVAYSAEKALLPAMKAFWDFTRAEGTDHLPRFPLGASSLKLRP